MPQEYYWDSKKMQYSVTGLIDLFFEKFDAEKVIDKMISGNNWPRDGYRRKDGTPLTAEEIKQKWDRQGLFARNRGTWMHYNFDLYFNDLVRMQI